MREGGTLFFGAFPGRKANNWICAISILGSSRSAAVCACPNQDDRLFALRADSMASRIDAKAFRGNVGDPWTPVHQDDGKSLTLRGGDFHYRCLYDLLFSGNWVRPLLARPRSDETGDMLLVAEAFARGKNVTKGFKSRVVPVPGTVMPLFSTESVGSLAAAQMQEIKSFESALCYALALMAAGGVKDGNKKDRIKKIHYRHASLAQTRFDSAADRLFFPSLWRRVCASTLDEDEASTAKRAFLLSLWQEAFAIFNEALPAVPLLVRPSPAGRVPVEAGVAK